MLKYQPDNGGGCHNDIPLICLHHFINSQRNLIVVYVSHTKINSSGRLQGITDEVDAPLDDANVGRFCDIVRTMSEKVQFVFITHNKVTMEMARQLTGVTMQEPGVSRLVSVDLDEAVKMAAS